MIFNWFRKDRVQDPVQTMLTRVIAASRAEPLYTDLGVPDTLEGRYESVILHMTLVLRRLRNLPPPADDFAQEFVDAFFKWLDMSLRDMGVGDLAVPKRMKKLVTAFYGRARSYGVALDDNDRAALEEALDRNVTERGDPAQALAAYMIAAEAALAEQDFDMLLRDGPDYATALPENSGDRHGA
jgi:cytochrome b pre-mRNA-processing protein 3